MSEMYKWDEIEMHGEDCHRKKSWLYPYLCLRVYILVFIFRVRFNKKSLLVCEHRVTVCMFSRSRTGFLVITRTFNIKSIAEKNIKKYKIIYNVNALNNNCCKY